MDSTEALLWGNLTTPITIQSNSGLTIRSNAMYFVIADSTSGGSITEGLVVSEDGILSGNMGVSAAGVLA